MRRPTSKDEEMIRYLLGNVSEEERDRLETLYFQDDTLHEELLALEEELIDSYARGKLTSDQREQFEKRYLCTPEGRERVEFARTLSDYIADRPAKEPQKVSWLDAVFAFFQNQSPALRFAAVAAALAILISPILVILRSHRGEPGGPTASKLSQPTPLRIPAPPEITKPPAPRVPVLSLVLLPMQRDGAAGNELQVPQGEYIVELHVRLEEDNYPTYVVTLETPEGRQIKRVDGLKSQPVTRLSRQVVVRFLSSNLHPPGDYILRLAGATRAAKAEEVYAYSFSVANRPSSAR